VVTLGYIRLFLSARLTGQTDARLADRLAEASRSGRVTQAPKDSGNDDDGDVADAPLSLAHRIQRPK
jgi:hypothetical protein